jgi:hypothetical protein
MKNRIIFLFFAIALTVSLCAQNSISDINRIKRDKNYLYGEATLENKDAALKLAYELLEVEIKNWATEKKAQISSVYATNIYEYADTIILPRHNMVRAFVFVKTSNLKAIKGKSVSVNVNQDEPLTKPVVDEPDIAAVEQEPQVEPQQEAIPESQSESIHKEETVLPPVEDESTVKHSTIKEEVLSHLLSVSSFYDLEKTIKPLKEEGKITDYGKYSTMSDPANCYLIVYDQQAQIKAFLDKGVTTRRNLKTGADDSEKNYHGCGAIWFKIKE